MESIHKEEMHGLPASQVYFNYTNRYALTKGFGKSVVSGKPTKFNEVTCKYEKFADDSERRIFRELFRQNMIKKYGKDTLLDEPEHQKKMLSSRDITSEYLWSDGKFKSTVTGTYEKKFIEFLDVYLDWKNPEDIMSPAPMVIEYKTPDDKRHFHIPDFYISSLNLIVNIKSSENKHYRLRDIESEMLQDESIKRTKYNYIKIFDNNFGKFRQLVAAMSEDPENQKRFIMV